MSIKSLTVSAAAALLFCAQGARADNDNDVKMKGIGMPIIFIVFFILAILLSFRQLMSAFAACRSQPDIKWVFGVSVLNALFSIFFYVSAGWAYGLVSTILAYFLACISSPAMMREYGRHAAAIYFVWFLILVGIPNKVSQGIVGTVKDNCASFYGSYQDKMCKDGWVTFLLIIATVQIGLTFLAVLVVMAASVGTSVVGQISALRGGAATGDYQEKLNDGGHDGNQNMNENAPIAQAHAQ